MAALVGFTVVAAVLFECAMGTTFIVGAPGGRWDQTTDLQAWAASQTISVGDTLLFVYTLNHNVLHVSKADYDACATSSPLSYDVSGASYINLKKPGKIYFICSTHCAGGMKLELDVSAASAGTTNATADAPGSSPDAPAADAPQSSPDVPTTDAPQSSPDVPSADAPQSSPDVPAADAPQSSPDVPAADAPQSSPDFPAADAPHSSPDVTATDARPSSPKAPASDAPPSSSRDSPLPEKSTSKVARSAAAGLKASAAAGVAGGLLLLLAFSRES